MPKALLVLLLLSPGQQQQVAAMSKFCRCYKQCYADCRRYSGPYPCNLGCIQDCFNGQPPPSAPSRTASLVCSAWIVVAMAGSVDVETCVDHCTKNLGQDQLIYASRVVTNDTV